MTFDPLALIGVAPLFLVVFLAVDLGGICIDKLWQKLLLGASVIVALAAMLAVSFFCNLGDTGDATYLILPVMAIPGIALRKLTWPQQIYTYCLLATITHLVIIVTYDINALVGGLSSWAMVAICTLDSLIAGAVLHFFFSKKHRGIMSNVPKGWGPACACAVVGAVVMFTFSVALTGWDLMSVVIDTTFTVFMLLICISVALTIDGLKSVVVSEHDLKLFKAQALKQQEVDQLRKDMQEEERRRRHDQRHALQAVIDELKDGNVDDAIAHIEEIRGSGSSVVASYCKNATANSALSLWVDKAEKAGIDVSVHADVPEELNVGPVELASIFGNILENAYEGCMRVERTEAHRFINIVCRYNKGKLSIQVRNSCRRDVTFVGGIPQTQKRGGGIGTRSVKESVERLGGLCTYSAADGVFETRIILSR